MALVEWNDNLSVGVATLDAQHKRLIGFINELYDAMKEEKGSEVIGNVLNGLFSYAKTHFKAEEAFMQQINFPGLPTQKVEHKKFTDDVEKFYNDFKAGKAVLSISIMNFLRNWLLDHIAKKDKMYGEFAKQKK